MKQKEIKINRVKLWILIGIAWIIPQVIIVYLPEELQILKPSLFIVFGLFICFDKSLDNWLIQK